MYNYWTTRLYLMLLLLPGARNTENLLHGVLSCDSPKYNACKYQKTVHGISTAYYDYHKYMNAVYNHISRRYHNKFIYVVQFFLCILFFTLVYSFLFVRPFSYCFDVGFAQRNIKKSSTQTNTQKCKKEYFYSSDNNSSLNIIESNEN